MAAVTDATYYTNQIGGALGDTRVKTYPRAQAYREYRIRRDLLGTESAADTFRIFKLKVGQTLVPGKCHITNDDGGTTLTMDVGDSTTADRYANGMDLGAGAGQINFCDPAIPVGEDTPFQATSALSDVLVTIATSGTPSAASVVFYLTVIDEYSEQ